MDINKYTVKNFTNAHSLQNVQNGGKWKPSNCTARHKVAIIIPFKNRENQLKKFVNHYHHILMRQELEYGIYVVNQEDMYKFNRAMLFNVGYAEASKENNWGCYVFHDVDHLLEDDRNLYDCPETPRHLSSGND